MKQTTVSLTPKQKKKLEEVKTFLEKEYGTASYADAIIHLHRLWKQHVFKEDVWKDKGKKNRVPEQAEKQK